MFDPISKFFVANFTIGLEVITGEKEKKKKSGNIINSQSH